MTKFNYGLHISTYFKSKMQFEVPSILLFLLTLTLITSSIYRFPILDQIDEFKISLAISELLGAFLLWVTIPRRYGVFTWLVVAILLVASRLMMGVLLAKFSFDQSFITSLQEARFGLLIASAPIVGYFLLFASSTTLKKLIIMYLAGMLLLDYSVFSFFSEDSLLIFGSRTEARYFCSVMIPLVISATLLLRYVSSCQLSSINSLLIFNLILLLHSVILTTSRVEILLSAGLMIWAFILRWPSIRTWLYFILFVVVVLVVGLTPIDDGRNVAGRDYGLAIQIAQNALPLGFGYMNDITAKTLIGIPQDFFFSDYGILLYIFRYGFIGILIACGLVLFWVYFVLSTYKQRGIAVFSISILIYVLIIPFLDYGSFGGGFLLAWMWYASNKKNYKVN